MRVAAIALLLLGVASQARGAARSSFTCADADAAFCTTNSVTKFNSDCLSKTETQSKCMKTCGFCEPKKTKVQDNIKCQDKSTTCATDVTDANSCDTKPELKLACCQSCMMKKIDISGTLTCADTWSQCTASTGAVGDMCCPQVPSKPNKTDRPGRKNHKTRCRTEALTQKNCLKSCGMCTTNTKNPSAPTRLKCADQLRQTKKKPGCTDTTEKAKCSTSAEHAVGTCCATCIFESIQP